MKIGYKTYKEFGFHKLVSTMGCGASSAVFEPLDAAPSAVDPLADTCLATLQGHTKIVIAVACFALADGAPRAISGSLDNKLRVWDPLAGTCLATLQGHTDIVFAVACIALADGAPRAISGSADKTLRVWAPVKWTAEDAEAVAQQPT